MNPNEIKKELETAMKLGDAPIGKNFGCTISKLTAKETLAYINQLEIRGRVLQDENNRLISYISDHQEVAVRHFAQRLKTEIIGFVVDASDIQEVIDNVMEEIVRDAGDI